MSVELSRVEYKIGEQYVTPDERRKQSSSEREKRSQYMQREFETCGPSVNVLKWFIWMPQKVRTRSW